MNHQILRRTIRKIIQEAWWDKYTSDIGDYAFAPQNPYLNPEQRKEQNSQIEDQIWAAIQKRVMDATTGPDFTEEMCDYLKAMILSELYPEVRGPLTVGVEKLYRGTYLSSYHLEYDMPDGRMVWEHLVDAEPGDIIDVVETSMMFEEGLFDREDIVASWTNSISVAKKFSGMNRVLPGLTGEPGSAWDSPPWIFNVVFINDQLEEEEFLDLSPFYQFDPTLDVDNPRTQLTSKSWEKEFLSLGSVPISHIMLLQKDSSGMIKLSM